MAWGLEKWEGAKGFTSPMITRVLPGTKRGKERAALQGWGWGAAALQSRTEATQSPPSPHTEVIRQQEAEPDIADTRPPYHILPQHPPTPHDTTSLSWHPTHCGNHRLIYILWYGYRGWKSRGCSRTLKRVKKKVRKKPEIRTKKKNACGDCFLYCFPVSWCGSRWRQAKQPANFRPINCKWGNYCRCFILASWIIWIKKSVKICCFWY